MSKKIVSLLSGSPDLQRRQLLCSLTVPLFHDMQHSLHKSIVCNVVEDWFFFLNVHV